MASDMQFGGGWLRGLLGGNQSAEAANGAPGTTTLAELKVGGVIAPIGPHAHPIPSADKTGNGGGDPNSSDATHGGTGARWLFAQNQALPADPAKIKRFKVDPVTKTVTLPDGTVLNSPQLDGKDLILRQKDGTVIIIEDAILVENGIASLPTVIIGGSVLLGATLTIVLGFSNEQVAAAAADDVGSGGDLSGPPNEIGPALDYGPLLPPTALVFPTLTRDELFEPLLEPTESLAPNLPPIVESVIVRVSEEGFGPQISLLAENGEGDECVVTPGNQDQVGNIDTTNDAFVSGQIVATDPNGDPLTFTLGEPSNPNDPSGKYFSGGQPITWSGMGTGVLIGTDAHGCEIIRVDIDNNGNFTVTLSGPIDHPFHGTEPAQEDQLQIDIPVTVSDGQFDVVVNLGVVVEDDSPIVTVANVLVEGEDGRTAALLPLLNLDETKGAPDRAAPGEATDANSALDEADLTDYEGLTPIGRLTTAAGSNGGPGALGALFDVNVLFGGDGPASVDPLTFTFSLVLTGAGTSGPNPTGVATTLKSLDDGNPLTDETIYLFTEPDGDIVGRVGGSTGDVAIKIYLTGDPSSLSGATLTVDQYIPLQHPDTGLHDEQADLALVGADAGDAPVLAVRLTAAVTDGDQDTNTQFANSVLADQGSTGDKATIAFDDDGPDAVVANAVAAMVVVDESPVSPDGDGIVSATGNFSVNFVSPADHGTDGPGSVSYALALSGMNVGSGLYALDALDTTTGDMDGIGQGAEIVLNQSGNTITGSVGMVQYFTITINPGTGVVTFTQLENVWHADTGNHDDTSTLTLDGEGEFLRVVQTVTDADGDSDTAAIDLGTGVFKIEDDGPDAVVANAVAAMVVVDESPVSPDGDGIVSATGNFSVNFVSPADHGTDGPGSVSYALALSGMNVGSGLYALDALDTTTGDMDGIGQGAEIVLNQSGNTITGSVGMVQYFTITINPGTGVVTFTQLENVWHADTGNHDDTSTLTLDGEGEFLRVVQTVTDADGDSDTAAIDLGTGVFKIEDDGPDAVVANAVAAMVVVDESPVSPDGDGIVSATGNFSVNFVSPADHGTDGPGSVSYALALSGMNVGSGLYALDALDTTTGDMDGIGQGAEIVLNQSGNTITGSVGMVQYFTITINPGTGVVTFTQLENVWHADTGNHDDTSTLTLDGEGEFLRVVQTVTDADGDSDTAAIDLGTGVFKIEDDGPDAVVANAVAAMVVVDESPVSPDGDGIVSATGNFSVNFVSPADHGTDGPGSVSYALALSGMNVGSGLYALDALDTTTGDMDGIGQGAEIVLNQSGNTITGSVGMVQYFTITINPGTGVVTFTQLENVWHADTGNHDDTSTLTLDGEGEFLRVVQTVTDADGDSDTAAIDLGTGVFKFEDDGPEVTVAESDEDIVLNLDETTNPDLDGVSDGADTYGSGDALPDDDGDLDDTGQDEPDGVNPIGSVTTAAGALAGLFSVTKDAGTDGEASDSRTLSLTLLTVLGAVPLLGVGVQTALAVTQPAAFGNPDSDGMGGDFTAYADPTIYLFLEGGAIVGRVGNDATGDIAFTITLSGSDPLTALLTIDQILAIDHPTTPTTYDEEATLALLNNGDGLGGIGLTLSVTVTDGDGDQDTDSATVLITDSISFDDDGHIAFADLDTIGLSGFFETFDNFEDLNDSAYRQVGAFNVNNSFGGTDGSNAAELNSNGQTLANVSAFFGDGGTALASIVGGFELSTGSLANLTNYNAGTGFESKAHDLTAGSSLSFDWAFRSAEPMTGTFDNDYAFWSLYEVTGGTVGANGIVSGGTYDFVSSGLIFDVNALRSNDLNGSGDYLRVDTDGDFVVDQPEETQGGRATTGWEFGLPYDQLGLVWMNTIPDDKTDQTTDITADASFDAHADVDAGDGTYLIPITADGTYVLRFGIVDIQAGGGGAEPSELNIDRVRIQEAIDFNSSGNVLLGTTDDPPTFSSGGTDVLSTDGSRVGSVAYDRNFDGDIADPGEVLTIPVGGSVNFDARYTGVGGFTIFSDGSYTYDGDPNTQAQLQADFPGATVYDEGFLYTAIDGDGDTSVALLTVRIDATSGNRSGGDFYIGSMFNDVFDGGGGNDVLMGRGGNDNLSGGLGIDTASYAAAAAGVIASLTAGTATGGDGTDALSGFENLTGSGFDDTLIGDGSANALDGGAGNDELDGGANNDTLIGGLGNDHLQGGAGNDSVSGGDGDDRIYVAGATDAVGDTPIDGGGGSDTLVIGTYDPTANSTTFAPSVVITGFGRPNHFETILGDSSTIADSTFTGDGNVNTFNFAGVTLTDVDVATLGGNDIVVTSYNHTSAGAAEFTTYDGGAGTGDTITLLFTEQQLEDILVSGTFRPELQGYLDGTVEAGDTILNLEGSTWDARVTAFENASLAISTGSNRFFNYSTLSGIGENLPDFDATPDGDADTVIGTAGNDAGGTALSGLAGDDILVGQAGADTLNGGNDDDLLLGGAGIDTLNGGSGVDVLFGGSDDDFLLGDAGNDILVGGVGMDTLTGGTNADTFVLNDITIADLIADFGAGADVVDLTALFDDPTPTPLPAGVSDYVFYDALTGKLYVDAAGAGADASDSHVATVNASGGGFVTAGNLTIVFDDTSGAQHTTTV